MLNQLLAAPEDEQNVKILSQALQIHLHQLEKIPPLNVQISQSRQLVVLGFHLPPQIIKTISCVRSLCTGELKILSAAGQNDETVTKM